MLLHEWNIFIYLLFRFWFSHSDLADDAAIRADDFDVNYYHNLMTDAGWIPNDDPGLSCRI